MRVGRLEFKIRESGDVVRNNFLEGPASSLGQGSRFVGEMGKV